MSEQWKTELLKENRELREELQRAHLTIEKVKEATRHGARMDLHPTRMGGSADTMAEAMWWQDWLIRFDSSWREELNRALENSDGKPLTGLTRNQRKAIEDVIAQLTFEDWLAGSENLAVRIAEVIEEFSASPSQI